MNDKNGTEILIGSEVFFKDDVEVHAIVTRIDDDGSVKCEGLHDQGVVWTEAADCCVV